MNLPDIERAIKALEGVSLSIDDSFTVDRGMDRPKNAAEALFAIARSLKDLADVMDGIRQVLIRRGDAP